MEKISFDPTRFTQPVSKAKNERASVLEMFLKRINPVRIAEGYPPLTGARIGVMLAHIKGEEDLYAFYKQCESYKGGFTRAFFGALKTKK